jgi:hypothetical protein
MIFPASDTCTSIASFAPIEVSPDDVKEEENEDED